MNAAGLSDGVIVLIAMAAALTALIGGRLRSWRRESRREEARVLSGTAGLQALAAEEERVRAAAVQRRTSSAALQARAASQREQAERKLEAASRLAAHARRLDPELEAEPDLDLPELHE